MRASPRRSRGCASTCAPGPPLINATDCCRSSPRSPAAGSWRSMSYSNAAADYMCIHAAGDTHILRGTMKELEEILDPKLFQRVHRSTIVNLRLVRSLRAHMNGEYFLTLEGGHELKLSRSYRDKIEYFLSGSAS